MTTYRLENLTVRHLAAGGAAALHQLDLVIAQGEQVALIGPSGAGKTTLLATLACAHRPDSGHFHAFGIDHSRHVCLHSSRRGVRVRWG